MMLLTKCKSMAGTQLHLGFWILKFLILAGTFGGSLFLPNDVFGVFAWIARFVSPIFTLFMLTMLCGGRPLDARATPRPSPPLARPPAAQQPPR